MMTNQIFAAELHRALEINRPVRCVDIGAMGLGKPEIWNLLAEKHITEVLGFEPITHECEKLNNNAKGLQTFLPYAIGDGQRQTLHITNSLMTSSLYKPNRETLELYSNLANLCEVSRQVEIDTRRLDNIKEAHPADFIKLDIQGGELMALANGIELLRTTGVAQIEVEFAELYTNQPLFSDIDLFMRHQGFAFHHFTYLMGRPYKTEPSHSLNGISQTLWGDAVYVRDPRYIQSMPSDQLRASAFILSAFFNSHDLALKFIEELDRRHQRHYSKSFIKIISDSKGKAKTNQQSPKESQAEQPGLAAIQTNNGLTIYAPNRIDSITSYVLLEKGTWFEQELPFLVEVVSEGDHVIDIGANYGIYTISFAQKVGRNGQVYAFEPASKTAEALRTSLQHNHFNQRANIIQAAISSTSGRAQLVIQSQSELNYLQTDTNDSAPNNTETVNIISLDEWHMNQQSQHHYSVVKIDAEGQESEILKGSVDFFASQSPLVMFEIKAGSQFNLSLIDEFQDMNYDVYQLIPGISALAPIDKNKELDTYLLNLFACKKDCAAVLSKKNLLLDEKARKQAIKHKKYMKIKRTPSQAMNELPYIGLLKDNWLQDESSDNTPSTLVIQLFESSQTPSNSLPYRFSNLQASYDLSVSLLKETTDEGLYLTRLASFARISRAMGFRKKCVDALRQLSTSLLAGKPLSLKEPFLLPSQKFDKLTVHNNRIAEFVLAATLHELNEAASYSSFYTPVESLRNIETIEKLGYGDQSLDHTKKLIQKRINLLKMKQQH